MALPPIPTGIQNTEVRRRAKFNSKLSGQEKPTSKQSFKFHSHVPGYYKTIRRFFPLVYRCGYIGKVGRLFPGPGIHDHTPLWGASMKSKPVALLLADLGLTKSHSRPHVSNDNPYSEAQFKAMKYRPDFPERFGGLEHARSFCHEFFTCYNTEHRHSGLGLLTPESVHYGYAKEILDAREVFCLC